MRNRLNRPMWRAFNLVVLAVAAMMIVAGCGSSDDNGAADTQPGAETSETTTTAPEPTDSGSSGTSDPAVDPADGIVIEGGTATFSIDGETYEFDAFLCAFGHDATQNENMAFVAVGEGTAADGTPVQVAVELYDDGIRDGFRVVHFLREGDSGDMEFVWTLTDTEPLSVEDPTGRAVLEQDGDNLSIEGGSYDRMENMAETGESAQGSLTGVCSPDSLR